MFIGVPKATRNPCEGRDRAYTIEQMMSSTLYEQSPDSRQTKAQTSHPSHTTTKYIKLQERTKTLLLRIVLLVIYITSGAAIFHVIESRNDDEEYFCDANGESEVEIEMARKFNASMKEIQQIVRDLCRKFEAAHRCKYSHNDWSYYQSLYFVGSVTTTIGYGHLAPKTQAGRLFLIFYAFFGIPINLLTLQSVGEHINVCFHKLITFVEKKLYKTNTVRHEHIKTFLLSIVFMILMLPIGGLMYYYSEYKKGWTYLDSVYYSFVAMSTIGFGDLVPNEGKEPRSTYEQVMWFIRLLFLGLGLSLVSSVFTSVSNATKQIKSAYMSKRGAYSVHAKKKQSFKRKSFKQAAYVKDLLCTSNVERTSRNAPNSPQHDMYSRFEDDLSTTSLGNNQSHLDSHVTSTRDSRSVSLCSVNQGADCENTRKEEETLNNSLELNIIDTKNYFDNTNMTSSEIDYNDTSMTSLHWIEKDASTKKDIKSSDEENTLPIEEASTEPNMTSNDVGNVTSLPVENDIIVTIKDDSKTCDNVKNNCRDDVTSNGHVINGEIIA